MVKSGKRGHERDTVQWQADEMHMDGRFTSTFISQLSDCLILIIYFIIAVFNNVISFMAFKIIVVDTAERVQMVT